MAPAGFNYSFCGADQNIGPFRTYGNEFVAYLRGGGAGGLDHRGFKLRWTTDEPRGNTICYIYCCNTASIHLA